MWNTISGIRSAVQRLEFKLLGFDFPPPQDVREEVTEEGVEATSFVRTLKAPSTKKKGEICVVLLTLSLTVPPQPS